MKIEAERQLAALVAMPTITDNIAANDLALDYLERYFAKRGLYCNRDRFDGHGTLVASTQPDNAKKPTLLLAGHIDVMTGSKQLFSLRREGDKFLGRGVYDMKFAIAGYMQLVDDLKHQLHDYDFAIMITSDEEYGGKDGINGTRRLVEAGHHPKVCILPDATAPGWNVESVAKGYWRFDLTATGRAAHGSRPWEGDSASFKLIQALHEIKNQFKDHGPLTNTLNIGLVHGGEAYNLIPPLMTASIEIRIISEETYQLDKTIIEDICKRYGIARQDRAFGLPVVTDTTNPFILSYMDSVEAVTGKKPQSHVSCGQSDLMHFHNAGVPCIVTCPEGGKHHSEAEWLSRKSFSQFVPILHDYVKKIAKLPPTSTSVEKIDTEGVLV